MADRVDIELDECGFAKTAPFTPVSASRSGVFIAGSFSGPKDIPETVVQASGAASSAASLLTDLPIKEIKELGLNRIIVSACTPRTHEPLFQKTLRSSGLNPYLFEFANIREHCSWVHQKEPEKATEKAKNLVRMAVTKASLLEPLSKTSLKVNKEALVIGGGVAGMSSALDLSNQGFDVHLVENEKQLGGNFQHVHYTLDGEETAGFLSSLIEKVNTNERIHLYIDSEIKEIEGYVGNFTTTIETNSESQASGSDDQSTSHQIEHGVVIVATGGEEYEPTEYLYGQSDRVITQRELEEKLAGNELSDVDHQPSTVVMIQCVGSRNEEHPYCSRVCCSKAIKNALKLKEINPEMNIYILYRDIRTYGLKELYYKQAREKGIILSVTKREANHR